MEDTTNGVKGGIGLGNLSAVNSNNNCVIGHGGYDKGIGRTNIYGHHNINLYTHGGIHCHAPLNCNDSLNCNAPINLPGNHYLGTSTPGHGLNCNNSDIIGVNGIRFNDPCSDTVNSSEGIFFLTDADSGKFDKLVAYGGNLYFSSKGSEHTSLCYTPGDTLNIGDNTPLAGYVSNARKTVFFSIPINKPLVNVIKTTLSGKIELRGVGGYVCSPTTRSATVTLTVSANNVVYDSAEKLNVATSSTEKTTMTTSLEGSLIRVRITFEDDLLNGGGYTTAATGATTVTNNTPLCIVPDGTLTVTFG